MQSRQTDGGVHQTSDIAARADTNAEAWIAVSALSVQGDYALLRDVTRDERDETNLSLARQAWIRLDQGQSAASQIAQLLAQQQLDGGFAPLSGLQSEALTTAWVLAVLDRNGQGTGSNASLALNYLLNTQTDSGGWLAAGGNLPSVYVTSQVARILVPFRNRFGIATQINMARDFLLGNRLADAYGDDFETALALESLLSMDVTRASQQPVADALWAMQQGDGSFADDAFVTAIALRALWLYEQPELPPAQSGLSGRVLAADTDLPIVGATLTLSGASSAVLVSNNMGRMQSNSLPAGAYSAELAFPGMRSLLLEFSLIDGATLALGDLRMTQDTGPSAQFGIIRGLVTDADGGAPIAGAVISLQSPPTQVISDSGGRYQFLQVPVGPVIVTATAAGYSSRQVQLEMAPSTIIEFSLELAADPGLSSALVRGIVTEHPDGTPLAGVSVSVTGGAPLVGTTTAADGSYSLSVEPGALVSLQANLSGYDPVTISSPLTGGQVLQFSPTMYPEGTSPVGANRSVIRGRVINQGSRMPIFNATVVVIDPAGQQVIRSDEDGLFEVRNLIGPLTEMRFSADAFEPANLLVPLLPLETRDIGDVGLRPVGIQYYLPDLVVTDSTLASSDPDSFALDSQFTVEIANRGSASLTQDFTLIAFVDGNGNGVFDEAVEPEVGRVRVTEDLPVGGSASVDIAVRAQLSFRDAPVAFWADADLEIPEQDEGNNTGSSLLGCQVTPAFIAQDTVRLAWHWQGLASDPQINSVVQVPSVVQLSDDNGDGVINQYDTPDIVFVAGQRNSITPSRTALVALSGDDGHELWSRTDFVLSHFSSPAVGDLDNDGIAEIVVVRGYRSEIIAFENDGTLKWRQPTGGPGIPNLTIGPDPYVFDQPVIVNLEGDSEAEVIYGRAAFSGFDGERLWIGEFDAGGLIGGLPTPFPLLIADSVAAVAADLDLNGVVDVLAGRTLYDVEGRAIWHRGDINPGIGTDFNETEFGHSAMTALGNFDLDDFAEIVLVAEDELYLLEHTGETIWGPKSAPDFNYMGSPAVIDVDADGLPEILVSSTTRLTVFESDGTVKWSIDIDDAGGITTPTVFDFENDGLYEVLHVDNTDIRILDARTGAQLFRTLNNSRTILENPVVADVDGDKEAEFIVVSSDSDFQTGFTAGIRVFEAAGGAWADAGSVWGSHSFHVSEINEDSTIPLLETPSWLTHNTYRVQRSPLPDPLGMPDFSVGDLRLIDQGPGNNPVVQVRVGNAGPVESHEPPYIGVYRGDPDAGGSLLNEIRLDTLRPARFQIVNLGEVDLAGNGDLYAVVDQRGRARECREDNNRRVIPFSATNGRGDLQLSTDRVSYRPGDQVQISAQVSNTGGLTADYVVEWAIRNASNQTTASFDPEAFVSIPSAGSEVRSRDWSSAGSLAGNYVLFGRLLNTRGTAIDTAMANFSIAGDVSGPAGSVALAASKNLYGPSEIALLSYRAQNLSDSESIRRPEVLISVSGPDGYNLQRTIELNDLFAGAFVDGQITVDGAAAAGMYSASAQLRSALTGFEYDQANASFAREADAGDAVQGLVDVAIAQIAAGQPQTCLFTARSLGPQPLLGVQLRQRAVDLQTATVHFEQVLSVDLQPGSDFVGSEVLSTAAYLAGDHACLLEVAQSDGGWRLLDSESFVVTGPPAAAIIVSPLFGLITSEAGQNAEFSVRLSRAPSAEVTVALQSSDTSEWALPVTSLSFSPENWSLPRTVTVQGVDDDLVDGTQQGNIEVLPATSGDLDFNGIDGPDVLVENLDDDPAQVWVTPLLVETSETGSTATFTVQINAEPTAPLQIEIVSSDSTEWTIDQSMLIFDAQNWTDPQTVAVTGVDDTELDGTIQGSIIVAPVESTDLRFAGIDPDDVLARNLDDEAPMIIVEPTSIVTAEGGAAESFVVRLGAAPSAPVTIAIGPVDSSEWQILDLQVVLDTGNWQSGYSVVVTPVDDTEVDGDQTAQLGLLPSTSADPNYAGIDPPDVQLTNLDNDAAQILVAPTQGLITDEGGASATFSVSLTEAPTAVVSIALVNPDSSEFALDTTDVIFAAGATGPVVVTITGVDDTIADGNVLGAIVLQPAVSDDTRYAGIDPANVRVTNLDNEVAQVVVLPSGSVETAESGTTANIELRLTAQPAAEVNIALTNPDSSEWSLSMDLVSFTTDNWATPQVVVVTGVNDFEIDGDVLGVIDLAPAVSADPVYNGLDPANVPAINRDDDLPAEVNLTPTDGIETDEGGSSAVITLSLSTQPSAPVRFTLTNPDPSEWHFDQLELVLDGDNWQTGHSLTVTGVDDDLVDGDISDLIVIGAAVSDDNRFAGIDPPDVPAVNRDDDGALVIEPVDLETSESGDGGRFSVNFNRLPAGEVRLVLSSADEAEITLAPVELVFDATNGTVAQEVLLSGVDDRVDDGDRAVAITVTVSSSEDPHFADLSESLEATNLDDDQAGIELLLTGPAQIMEGESTDLSLRLLTEPVAAVQLTVTALILPPGEPDALDFALQPLQLSFDADNWNDPQPLILQTSNNERVNGDQVIAVDVAMVQTEDPVYAGVGSDEVEVTVIDLGETLNLYQIPANQQLAWLWLLIGSLGLLAIHQRGRW
ncbi:MAG: carboxypeptidase regulatory-like domain-containing protein [Xanthomonadales bacterium]|nr:carboxypeptidase regulatory-like domain-containing protein [Xanthomonadales bacterium]